MLFLTLFFTTGLCAENHENAGVICCGTDMSQPELIDDWAPGEGGGGVGWLDQEAQVQAIHLCFPGEPSIHPSLLSFKG